MSISLRLRIFNWRAPGIPIQEEKPNYVLINLINTARCLKSKEVIWHLTCSIWFIMQQWRQVTHRTFHPCCPTVDKKALLGRKMINKLI